MVNLSKSESLQKAFVVDEKFLNDLKAIISDDMSQEHTVKYSDNTELHVTTLDQVIGASNENGREIIQISLYGYKSSQVTYKRELSIRLKFEASKHSPIQYSISGAEELTYSAIVKTESAINSITKWYSRFSLADWYLAAYGSLLIWMIVLLVMASFLQLLQGEQTENDTSSSGLTFTGIMFIFLIVGATQGIGFIVTKLVKWIFPISVFAIGRGVERYETLKFWRTGVIFLGVIIPVIVTLILNWIT